MAAYRNHSAPNLLAATQIKAIHHIGNIAVKDLELYKYESCQKYIASSPVLLFPFPIKRIEPSTEDMRNFVIPC